MILQTLIIIQDLVCVCATKECTNDGHLEHEHILSPVHLMPLRKKTIRSCGLNPVPSAPSHTHKANLKTVTEEEEGSLSTQNHLSKQQYRSFPVSGHLNPSGPPEPSVAGGPGLKWRPAANITAPFGVTHLRRTEVRWDRVSSNPRCLFHSITTFRVAHYLIDSLIRTTVLIKPNKPIVLLSRV